MLNGLGHPGTPFAFQRTECAISVSGRVQGKDSFKLLKCNDTDITVSSLKVPVSPNQDPDFGREDLPTFRISPSLESHHPRLGLLRETRGLLGYQGGLLAVIGGPKLAMSHL